MSGLRSGSLGVDGVSRSDVLVVGSGAAGLTAALGCKPLRVTVLTKARVGTGGSSPWAQGGVAAAVGRDDAPGLHAADTMAAGAGLNDSRVVDILTAEGPARVKALLALGAQFDLDDTGSLALGREAAHSRRRILHSRDATGAEIVRTLVEAVQHAPEVRLLSQAFALDLVMDGGQVVGALAVHADGRRVLHLAPAVVLAAGGLGRLYLHTTNPPEATGDGLAMAARAGAQLVDVEFVQFHPTALAAEGADPMPLLTEALRGEGATLIDETGHRFMTDEHPDRELAPRDVVARAIWHRLMAGHRVFLDAREAVGQEFPERFPTVFNSCRRYGLDPRTESIPVAPAAHYHMGGVAVDERGRTSLPGLWACGEVSATGVHGANRLASNSLLEALVFGARVAEDLTSSLPSGTVRGWRVAGGAIPGVASPRDAGLTAAIRRLMWEKVGLLRDGAGLTQALEELERLALRHPQAAGEARNLLWAGRIVTAAALERKESRGGHYRSDHPEAEPAWQRRLFLTAAPNGSVHFETQAAQAPLVAAGSRRS
ncbi:MAG TPA: L-aspartate oxidase [Thermoanaerobaculia bacterium]